MINSCAAPCPDGIGGRCPFKKVGDNFPETECPYLYCPYYEKANPHSAATRV